MGGLHSQFTDATATAHAHRSTDPNLLDRDAGDRSDSDDSGSLHRGGASDSHGDAESRAAASGSPRVPLRRVTDAREREFLLGSARTTRYPPRSRQGSLITIDEIEALPIVPHVIYAILSEYVYEEPDRRPLPHGWRQLLDARECGLDREGYFAAAFVHDALRVCVVAQRGTDGLDGLRAGIWVYFDEPTIQFHLAEQFSKQVRLRLDLATGGIGLVVAPAAPEGGVPAVDVTQPYTVSYTGHSLGAVLAACRAAAEQTFAVTFESPGCKAFVEKTMSPFRAEDIDVITYLRHPNPINTLKPQCGYLVQLPFIGDSLTPEQVAALKQRRAAAWNNAVARAGNALTRVQAAVSVSGVGAATVVASSTNGGVVTAAPIASTKSTAGSATASAPTASGMRRSLMPNFSALGSPQEYLRSRLLEAAIPELQAYLMRLEPLMRELLDHTHQVHSISGIVASLQRSAPKHRGQDVILRWPSHLMQFIEYYNTKRALELPANQQEAHIYAAFNSQLQQIYRVEGRPRFRIPLRYLSRGSILLLRVLLLGTDAEWSALPLTERDRRVLQSAYVVGQHMVSQVLSAFQMKQFLAVVAARPQVMAALERYSDSLALREIKARL
jgi:hypothetical protein